MLTKPFGINGLHLRTQVNPAIFCILIAVASPAVAQDPDPRLCAVVGDPVAAAPFNLVDSYCIPPAASIGAPGAQAKVEATGSFMSNANGQLDVFVIWEPDQFSTSPGESITYSSRLEWEANKPDAVFKEWVGNFTLPGGPQAFMIANSADTDLTPAELVMTPTSGTVTNRTFTHDMFPPVPIGRYHIQITGLDPFVPVTFSKSANGAHVVPEPSGALFSLQASCVIAVFRRRRKRGTPASSAGAAPSRAGYRKSPNNGLVLPPRRR